MQMEIRTNDPNHPRNPRWRCLPRRTGVRPAPDAAARLGLVPPAEGYHAGEVARCVEGHQEQPRAKRADT